MCRTSARPRPRAMPYSAPGVCGYTARRDHSLAPKDPLTNARFLDRARKLSAMDKHRTNTQDFR
eukprot:scaffold46295_cov62-Phaeocystis_antarctica.AAC.4